MGIFPVLFFTSFFFPKAILIWLGAILAGTSGQMQFLLCECWMPSCMQNILCDLDRNMNKRFHLWGSMELNSGCEMHCPTELVQGKPVSSKADVQVTEWEVVVNTGGDGAREDIAGFTFPVWPWWQINTQEVRESFCCFGTIYHLCRPLGVLPQGPCKLLCNQ